MTLRVLVVETSLSENGGLRVSLDYARHWRRAGLSTEVAVLKDGVRGAVVRPDPTLEVSMLTCAGGRFRYSWVAALMRLIRRARQCDIVVSGSEAGLCVLFGYVAARIVGKPFVVHVQADINEAVFTWVPAPLRPLNLWVLAHVDAAICVAQSVADVAVAGGLPAWRAHVVTNGIDVAAVRSAAQSDIGDVLRSDGRLLVVALGRLSPQKDFAMLLQAHAKVRAAGVDHRLLILGEGADRPELEALIDQLGVAGSVELPGFVANPHPIVASADLFVLSSRSEGMPLTLIEALAVGASVIATRCGSGPGLILADGAYGDLVPVESVDMMAEAIERNLRDPSLLRRRAASGPGRALDFDIARSADTVKDLMLGLIGRSSGRSSA